MAWAFPGITNENSFFSDHYLATLFAGHRREWERQADLDAASAPAWRQLQRMFHQCRHAQAQVQREPVLPQAAGAFQYALLAGLGYERQRDTRVLTLHGQTVGIPVLTRMAGPAAADALWILEVREPGGAQGWGQDPLALAYEPALYAAQDVALPHAGLSLRAVIEAGIYSQPQPPRWLLVMSLAHIVLLDRYKWAEERRLRFDLEAVFAQSEVSAWHALRALLHRQSLVPAGAVRGMERFDEESRRHAQSVSADLKYALREAVELLGNAAVEQLITQRRQERRAIWTGPAGIDEAALTRECLRYMYRLLFLLFVEAQPQLGHSALRAPVYQQGYSLENLRNTEIRPLGAEADTWFLHESLQTLFGFFRAGTPFHETAILQGPDGVLKHDFRLEPIDADLFATGQNPLLDAVRIPDRVWRRIIELLSLSRPRKQGRGRISYAQLGVNQLGAVYEALLSYTGFFAREDLIEVKRAQAAPPDVLDRAWLEPRSRIDRYTAEEIVYDGNEPRTFAKGTFIYRLTGYGREESASFYTPEALTRCTVKYALPTLLQDCPADEILALRLCEPAMGSAAFLIEAVNQLADAYLQRKQQELGQSIAAEDLIRERQRVRTYITARNAFGVDINPGALELGAISLWLNCMEPEGRRPDFQRTLHGGRTLHVGNSLIGARRDVIPCRKDKSRMRPDIPAIRALGQDARQDNEIYHFLLLAREMVGLKAQDMQSLVPEAAARIRNWGRDIARPYSMAEYQILRSLSAAIDELWLQVAEERGHWRQQYEASLPRVYGQSAIQDRPLSPQPWHCEAYERLQYAMNYWCSLWFWPLDKLAALPTREQFLAEMGLMLTGHRVDLTETVDWIRQAELADVQSRTCRTLLDRPGAHMVLADLETALPARYHILQAVTEREHFFHWPLAFADIFLTAGGFHCIVGNPPWVKLNWSEKSALAAYDPQIILRKLSADRIARRKPDILDTPAKRSAFLARYRQATGAAAYGRYPGNYPVLAGIQPNKYKMFLARAFQLAAPSGVIGFLHPVDHLQDPKGMALRRACYRRLAWLFQFANERKHFMFSDIHNNTTFAVGIYTGRSRNPDFQVIANLFAPETVAACLTHDGAGPVPGIKDDKGQWQLQGHRSRIIDVDVPMLSSLGSVLDATAPPEEVRLPLPHSRELAQALLKIAAVPVRLGDHKGRYLQDSMWNETSDRKPPKPVFRRATDFYPDPRDMILSGPIFGLANPLAKCPRPQCKSNQDYEGIDLTAIPDDYLPRVNYTPVLPWLEYRNQVRTVPWDAETKHLELPRLMVREYVGAASERTLQGALIGEGLAHVHVCQSLAFADPAQLLQVCTQWQALPYDFLTKSFQISHIQDSFTSRLPLVELPDTALHRTLQLNCLTTHLAPLWNQLARQYTPLDWSGTHPSLEREGPRNATSTWQSRCARRTDFARRQALLEIDVMVAMALELSLDELIQIYRLVFPVMRSYEENTWYDRHGRMVWSKRTGKGMPMTRRAWEHHRDMPRGVLAAESTDNTMPGGPRTRTIEYAAPFFRPDREQDYRQAWAYFTQHR